MERTARNDPCPCGSGRKYKHCCGAVASFAPQDAESHFRLGSALHGQGRLREAIACYGQALLSKPDFSHAHHDLGKALEELGQTDAALASYQRALALEEAPEFKASFAQFIRNIDFIRIEPVTRRLVARAISEPWARPADLAITGIRILKLDQRVRECIERASNAWPAGLSSRELFGPSGTAALSDDPLLQSLLESSPIADIALERFLTLARRALLEDALGTSSDDGQANEPGAFHCALARQCFINEFVFFHAAEEFRDASSLRDRLGAALQAGIAVPPLWVVAVAAYFPLLSLPSAETLPSRDLPQSLRALLVQHIAEPLQERQLRDAMPALTGVEGSVSSSVRRQYEENPFPRWIKLPPPEEALAPDAYLRQRFPCVPPGPIGRGRGIDLLIAGCGTGRETIEIARQVAGARVLAIDLSLASLGYAKRKSLEFGMKDIEFAQADIVKLGAIDRTFDLISSVGVLHHLADPVAGLRGLLQLLRPGGFMILGLYSERGRRGVVAARKFIAERGYASDAAGIRQCRVDLMSMDDAAEPRQVTASSDFYVTSECRDLLFHVQEHRFTLPRIKDVLTGLGLAFNGFIVEPHIARKYMERFPNDPAMTSLDCWNDFETEFPNAFASMYVFLVRKPEAGPPD